jgi:hypothetical protein
MYAGHLGMALLTKGLRRDEPLSLLITASIVTDLAGAALDISGWKILAGLLLHTIPGTLSLGLVMRGLVFVVGRNGQRALLAGLLVLLHTLADYVTSYLPLWPNGPMVGLYLYRFPLADLLVEGGVVLAGWWVYRSRLSSGVRNSWATWMRPVLLILCQSLLAALLRNA